VTGGSESPRPPGPGLAAENLHRLHHVAYVVEDQERTRHFYEDVVGLPLIAAWAEVGEFNALPGKKVEMCHTFFGLGDGSALAFFAFAEPSDYEKAKIQNRNGFTHAAIAVSREAQLEVKERLESAGYPTRFIDHGYCLSLYVNDPDHMSLEFTCDPDNLAEIAVWQGQAAHSELARWVAGDRTPNNDLRRH
jgi:glyoxylase I family protein